MHEGGATVGITTVGIEGNRQTGHVRIWILYGKIKPKIIEIPVGTMGEPQAGFLMIELDNAQVIAAAESNVIVKL